MQTNDFYVTLLSDNDLQRYPENQQRSFRNSFASSIHLVGDYFIGITDIVIPFSFYNIDTSNNTFFVHINSSTNEKKKK